jgi:hypothetical protein
LKFDDAELRRALGHQAGPSPHDRAGRVQLLAEAFEALRDGRQPSRQAALFLAGAGLAWLHQAPERGRRRRTFDYFVRIGERGSHMTAARLMLHERKQSPIAVRSANPMKRNRR